MLVWLKTEAKAEQRELNNKMLFNLLEKNISLKRFISTLPTKYTKLPTKQTLKD